MLPPNESSLTSGAVSVDSAVPKRANKTDAKTTLGVEIVTYVRVDHFIAMGHRILLKAVEIYRDDQQDGEASNPKRHPVQCADLIANASLPRALSPETWNHLDQVQWRIVCVPYVPVSGDAIGSQ